MYKLDLALNNLQWLICNKTKSNIKFRELAKYFKMLRILI